MTLGLAIPSALAMLAAALTYPLLGEGGTGWWVDWLVDGSLEHTVLTAFGVTNAWLAVLPVLAALVAAVVFAALATPRVPIGGLAPALYALLAWTLVSIVGPTVVGDPSTPLSHGDLLGAGPGRGGGRGVGRDAGHAALARPAVRPPGGAAAGRAGARAGT